MNIAVKPEDLEDFVERHKFRIGVVQGKDRTLEPVVQRLLQDGFRVHPFEGPDLSKLRLDNKGNITTPDELYDQLDLQGKEVGKTLVGYKTDFVIANYGRLIERALILGTAEEMAFEKKVVITSIPSNITDYNPIRKAVDFARANKCFMYGMEEIDFTLYINDAFKLTDKVCEDLNYLSSTLLLVMGEFVTDAGGPGLPGMILEARRSVYKAREQTEKSELKKVYQQIEQKLQTFYRTIIGEPMPAFQLVAN